MRGARGFWTRRVGAALVAAAGAVPAEPAELPMRFVGRGLILVSVDVQGGGLHPFLIDTGSTISVVSRRLARKLELPRVASGARVRTLGGGHAMEKARLGSLKLGTAEVRELVVLVADLEALSDLSDPALGGILGNDVLSDFSVLLDFANGRLRLDAPQETAEGLAVEGP